MYETNVNLIEDSLSLLFKSLSLKPELAALAKLNLEQWQSLLSQAHFQSLTPLLFQRLVRDQESLDIPKEIIQHTADEYYDSLGRNLILYNQLNQLLSELERQNIQAILLKGIYLAKFIYGDIALRSMSDVDILVRREDLIHAMAVLKNLGYTTIGYATTNDPITEEVLHYYHHAPEQQKANLIRLDLHWQLTDCDCGLKVDVSALWEHAQTVQLSEVAAMGLSLEDLLLHICIHAAYAHTFFQQVRSVVDLAEILGLKSSQINWQFLLKEAHDWRIERGVFAMLYISQQYLAAPVPDQVLLQLAPQDFSPAMLDDILYLFMFRKEQISSKISRLANHVSWKELGNNLLRLFFPPRVRSRTILFSPR